MSPSQEFELKFSLTPDALEALLHKLGKDGKWQRQTSVYYDTPKHKLLRKGMVLRVRSKGDHFVQTLKTGGPSALIRHEWEKDVPDENLVLTAGETSPEKTAWKQRGKLRPIFSVQVERLSLPLGNVQIDIDKGRIEKDGDFASVCEIEFELKSGAMAEAVPKIRDTLESVAAELSFVSKSARGFALGVEPGPLARHAEPLAFDQGLGTADGFQTIALSCLSHLASNKIAVQQGEAAGIHQMRIGLRRLRAAVSLFGDVLHDAPRQTISAELKWLTGELGPARDFEVLLSDEALKAAFDDAVQRDKLLSALDRQRLDGLARAKAAVESERYRLLLLETVLWIIGDACKPGETSVSAFAEQEMPRRLRKILKKLKRVDDLDDNARHRLRIAVKKLRYGTEFFEPVFGSKSGDDNNGKDFSRALKSLQDGLGRLHDFAVHKDILAEIGGADAASLEKLIAHEKKETVGLLKAIRKSGHQLAKAETPW